MDASFVMAIVAVTISGLSAIASFIALGQTARYHPAPFMTAKLKADRVEASVFVIQVVNMGRASAHDVRLVVRNFTMGDFAVLWNALKLDVSVPQEAQISRVNGRSEFGYGAHGIVYPGDLHGLWRCRWNSPGDSGPP